MRESRSAAAPPCVLCRAADVLGTVHVDPTPNGHGWLLRLTFSWVCGRCGHRFTDRVLEAMNGPPAAEVPS